MHFARIQDAELQNCCEVPETKRNSTVTVEVVSLQLQGRPKFLFALKEQICSFRSHSRTMPGNKRIFIGPEPGNTLKIALLGLPNSGKSLLYNNLVVPPVNNLQPVDTFLFSTLDPTRGSYPIPDPRLDWYEKIFGSLNVKGLRTIVSDGPALVRGSHLGEGEGMQFMEDYREADVLYYVLRGWEDDQLTHFEETVDPCRDAHILNQELLMADLQRIETRLVELYTEQDQAVYDHQPIGKNNKWARWTLQRAWHWIVGHDRKEHVVRGAERDHDPLPSRCDGWAIRHGEWNSMECFILDQLHLFTAKPVVYVLNIPVREHTRNRPEWLERLQQVMKKQELGMSFHCCISLKFEDRLCWHGRSGHLDHYLEANPSHKTAKPELHTVTAEALDLITFYTGKTPLSTPGFIDFIPEPNQNELFAWRCRNGKIAQDAAALVDTDLGRYFNRLTMYSHADLVEEKGDFDQLIENNKNRMQQKRYIITDGDVVDFVGFGVPAVEFEAPKKGQPKAAAKAAP